MGFGLCQGSDYCSRSFWAYSCDPLQFTLGGGCDHCDRSEPRKERLRAWNADPGDRREQADRGDDDRAPADLGRCPALQATVLLMGEHVQPQRGVFWRRRPEQSDPVVKDLEQSATDRARRDGAIVQVGALNHQAGAARIAAQGSDLAPYSAVYERAVEVGNGLAFNDALADRVVTDRQSDEGDVDPECGKCRRYVRSSLTHVNGYRHPFHDESSSQQRCVPFEPTQYRNRVRSSPPIDVPSNAFPALRA